MTSRTEQLAGRLDRIEVDALLVTDDTNVRYLSGFTGDSSALLVERSRTTMISDGRFETQLREECPDLAVAIRPPSEASGTFFAGVIRDRSLRRVGFEAEQMTVAGFAQLSKQTPGIDWVETSNEVERLRSIKDVDEIATIREAVQIAERAFRSVCPRITPNTTEREIAFELEAVMRTLGADGVSFPPIVAAGPAGALPHYRPGSAAVGDAPTLLIDWGASFRGYASDLTRTLRLSTPSPRFRDAYEAVRESQMAAIEAIGPGIEARHVDGVARRILAAAGLAEAFKHSLGHGLGREVHESPRLAAVSDDTLRPGMVVTVEPGVYFEGEFGIRIEDDVLVTETGHELLGRLPKGLDDDSPMG